MAFLNGARVAPEHARIDPGDRGPLLGDGLFETMLAENGRILFLDALLARLPQGAAALAIPVPL